MYIFRGIGGHREAGLFRRVFCVVVSWCLLSTSCSLNTMNGMMRLEGLKIEEDEITYKVGALESSSHRSGFKDQREGFSFFLAQA